MRLPRRRQKQDSEPPKEPERLSQRWAIILGISGLATAVLLPALPMHFAASTGVAMVLALHKIMA